VIQPAMSGRGVRVRIGSREVVSSQGGAAKRDVAPQVRVGETNRIGDRDRYQDQGR